MLTQRCCFQQPLGIEFPLSFPEAIFVTIALIATRSRRNLGIRNDGVWGNGIFEIFGIFYWLFKTKNSWTEVKNATTLSYILLKHLILHTWRLQFLESNLRGDSPWNNNNWLTLESGWLTLYKHLLLHTWRLQFLESNLRAPRETKRPLGMGIPGSLIAAYPQHGLP